MAENPSHPYNGWSLTHEIDGHCVSNTVILVVTPFPKPFPRNKNDADGYACEVQIGAMAKDRMRRKSGQTSDDQNETRPNTEPAE